MAAILRPLKRLCVNARSCSPRQVRGIGDHHSVMNSVDASRNFGTAVSACDPYFAAIEPFTKRANHRYNIRNRHTCPASDAVHQEVAGYKDREDFEAYNEGYLDAHTAAIEALALAFEKLVDGFEGLQNGGSSY